MDDKGNDEKKGEVNGKKKDEVEDEENGELDNVAKVDYIKN